MQTSTQADIQKIGIDMEQYIPGIMSKSKGADKHACLKFYDQKKPLYLETNASGVGLGAGIKCTTGETPDNTIH